MSKPHYIQNCPAGKFVLIYHAEQDTRLSITVAVFLIKGSSCFHNDVILLPMKTQTIMLISTNYNEEELNKVEQTAISYI